MKRTVFLLVSGLLCLPLRAQDIPENDAALMDEFVAGILKIEKNRIESPAISRVFKGNFYKIVPTFYEGTATLSCSEFLVVINDNFLSQVEQTDEDKSMEKLYSLVKEGFTIRDENEARLFEEALDELYPLGWSDKKEDKKHYLQEDTWYFLRGEFFDAMKGFLVRVDESGKLIQIDYLLKAVE